MGVLNLLHNVLGPVVHTLMDTHGCSVLRVHNEPVYTSRRLAAVGKRERGEVSWEERERGGWEGYN